MGRKKSPIESVPLPRIAVDLVPDLFQAVDEYCRERGMMKTEFARMAIIDMAERKGIFPLKKKTGPEQYCEYATKNCSTGIDPEAERD